MINAAFNAERRLANEVIDTIYSSAFSSVYGEVRFLNVFPKLVFRKQCVRSAEETILNDLDFLRVEDDLRGMYCN